MEGSGEVIFICTEMVGLFLVGRTGLPDAEPAEPFLLGRHHKRATVTTHSHLLVI